MKKELLVYAMAIIILLISSCVPMETQPVPSETSTPTEAPSTDTPMPGWVTDFAEPILNAIADRPPTYQDDFSDRQSGWSIGRKEKNLDPQSQATPPNPGNHLFGESGYVDGEYFTIADPYSCLGGRNSEMDANRDFVAEFDVRFVSEGDGGWEFNFHRNDIGKYSLGKWIEGGISFSKCNPQINPECGVTTDSGDDPTKGPHEWNRFRLIVQGIRMAAYVNGVPILYYEDKVYTDDLAMGIFVFSTCTSGNTAFEVRWDNFKVWDISKLP